MLVEEPPSARVGSILRNVKRWGPPRNLESIYYPFVSATP